VKKTKLVAIAMIAAAISVSAMAEPPDPSEGGTVVTKEQIIKKLGLTPLPGEGGYYKETYRCQMALDARTLGIQADGQRNLGTAIYYMVTGKEFSALHRLPGDEIFHFYAGDPVEMVQFDPKTGEVKKIILGSDILGDQQVQVVVPAGVWQGTHLVKGGKWALLGTTMAPGFDFHDFELGDRKKLLDQFPSHMEDIQGLTRE
jgi:predicted cupin superfamily sugar epimerase